MKKNIMKEQILAMQIFSMPTSYSHLDRVYDCRFKFLAGTWERERERAGCKHEDEVREEEV